MIYFNFQFFLYSFFKFFNFSDTHFNQKSPVHTVPGCSWCHKRAHKQLLQIINWIDLQTDSVKTESTTWRVVTTFTEHMWSYVVSNKIYVIIEGQWSRNDQGKVFGKAETTNQRLLNIFTEQVRSGKFNSKIAYTTKQG